MEASQHSETLNESWVQLAAELDDDDSVEVKPDCDEDEPQSIVSSVNKFLLERARGKLSKTNSSIGSIKTISSNPSGKETPESQTPKWDEDLSLINVLENSERVWDWASRPELVPPPGYESKMYYPGGKRSGSYYNRYGQKVTIFSWDNLPQLLLSHATAFLLGAAAAFAFSRLRSAANYGSVLVAASEVTKTGPQQTLHLGSSVDSSRSAFYIWDRIF